MTTIRRSWQVTALTTASLLLVPTGLSAAAPAAPAPSPLGPTTVESERLTQAAVSAAGPSAAPAAAAAPAATTTAAAEQRIAAKLPVRIRANAIVRGHVVGVVRDAATGRLVWSSGGSTGQMPASTTKVGTAIAALTVLDPESRLTTAVLQSAYRSRIVLRAGGDPELTTAHLAVLADRTAATLRATGRPRISLRVDDSIFAVPTLAPGWRSGYFPSTVTPIRGLKVDRRYVSDTSLDAARTFARLLRARGVTVADLARERGAPVRRPIATVQGWTVRQIVQRMINVSSNDSAEYLARLVARRLGYRTDWASVRAAVRAALSQRARLSLRGYEAYDGSGVSRSNRITPEALVRFVRHVQATPRLRAVLFAPGAVPRSGIDGTLANRYRTSPTSCARGRVQAKTGTLTGAVTLSGRTTATDGRVKVFAFMVFGRNGTTATREGIDRLASTVTGCW